MEDHVSAELEDIIKYQHKFPGVHAPVGGLKFGAQTAISKAQLLARR